MDWNLSSRTHKSASLRLFDLSEFYRIKAYLAGAELKLRNSKPDLSSHHMAKREQAIENLHEYRMRGIFPKNDFVDEYSSVFTDRKGTICAVAHLVQASGRGDLVEKISNENNLLSLAKTTTDILDPWLEDNGISYDEAAFIQVPYNSQPEVQQKLADTSQNLAASGHQGSANVVMIAFIALTVVFLVTTAALIFFKRRKNKRAALVDVVPAI